VCGSSLPSAKNTPPSASLRIAIGTKEYQEDTRTDDLESRGQ